MVYEKIWYMHYQVWRVKKRKYMNMKGKACLNVFKVFGFCFLKLNYHPIPTSIPKHHVFTLLYLTESMVFLFLFLFFALIYRPNVWWWYNITVYFIISLLLYRKTRNPIWLYTTSACGIQKKKKKNRRIPKTLDKLYYGFLLKKRNKKHD